MEKGIVGKLTVYAFNSSTGLPVTGDSANITCKISKDGATEVALTDTNPTERINGYYDFDVTATEADAKEIFVYPESTTADTIVIGVPAKIVTTPPNYSDLGIESDGDLTQVNNCVVNTDMVDISGLSTFDPTTDTVANVTTVATCTENTDMVDVSGLSTFDPTTDEVETGYTWIQVLRKLASFAGGDTTNSGLSFWDLAKSKVRLVFTTDSSNNRTLSSEDLD